ncbi:MAG: hypothetical protein HN790_16085 [Methylococcales bacterium]|mgnify:CR=1 FL=1|jgi:sensor domain CHASE-containing protein|nr:hypothetical protein [Methylococcales bacterium]
MDSEQATAKTFFLPSKWSISLLVFMLSMFVTSSLWYLLRQNELASFQQKIQEKTHLAKSDIQQYVESHILSLQRMANRWEINHGTEQKKWALDAKNYVKTQAGLRTVEWVDKTYHVRWVVPLKGNEKAQGLYIIFDDQRKKSTHWRE